MTDADSDRLLRNAHALGKAAGCYTEYQMDEQCRTREEVSLEDRLHLAANAASIDIQMWRSLELCLRRAHCPARAAECFNLWLKEWSFRQIAELPRIAVSDKTVAADVRLALRIVRADPELGLIEVLCEVFRLRAAELRSMLDNG
jgi:hypothetical protein